MILKKIVIGTIASELQKELLGFEYTAVIMKAHPKPHFTLNDPKLGLLLCRSVRFSYSAIIRYEWRSLFERTSPHFSQ